ncbi:hypothetical protein TsFJ059_004153 [Trichoderma semiorbis]|uniref:SET domain-containing protein n=1 Tax=Trichoderma semiorbis TaxID=1491008 RepID=A0A9P8KPN7_9HYPO|nr:hypothetical protein TsFJ059_004153 [Trichoderma semiorbis]
MSKPKNWPATLPYLKAPLYGKDISPSHIQFLRTKPPNDSSAIDQVPIAPASSPATETPCPRVKIQAITDRNHPAYGQFGLFAAQNIAPGELILAYLGRLHGRATTSEESDYDLWLDREMDVAVDAAGEGNEGRWGEVCVGVWAVGGGSGKAKEDGKKKTKKKSEGGIKKGEEILVSYGKGFWEERRKDGDGDGDGGGEM